jgi:anti-anti-sigma factor
MAAAETRRAGGQTPPVRVPETGTVAAAALMELSEHEEDGIQILECTGELNLAGSVQLKERFMQLVHEQQDRFIISLREVTRIDSRGVGAIIFIAATARKLELSFALTETPAPVMRVIEKLRLKSYLPFIDKREDALNKLEESPLLEL